MTGEPDEPLSVFALYLTRVPATFRLAPAVTETICGEPNGCWKT